MKAGNGRQRTVLVSDADRGTAVAVIRSLGRAGFRVIAADSHAGSLGFRSRYASESVIHPPADSAPAACAEALEHAVRRFGVDLVIPVTDQIVHLLAAHRDRFEPRCRLALPDDAALRTVMDKSATVALAERLGVPTPRTVLVRTPEEAAEAAEALGWPVVIKRAAVTCYRPGSGCLEKLPVRYANDMDQLAARLAPLGGDDRVLIQEYFPGAGCGVEMLTREGRVIAAFQHRRLAEVPMSGGASAWRESVPLDPELYGHSKRLVEALAWTGLIMVEFKVGRSPKLMEINGRIWGSLPLAVASGVDFPALLAEMLLGGHPAARSTYRVGVQAFNLELTLLWIASVLAQRRRYPFLPHPRRREALSAARAMLGPRGRFDILSLEDPRPGLAEFSKIARKMARKLVDRVRGGGNGHA